MTQFTSAATFVHPVNDNALWIDRNFILQLYTVTLQQIELNHCAIGDWVRFGFDSRSHGPFNLAVITQKKHVVQWKNAFGATGFTYNLHTHTHKTKQSKLNESGSACRKLNCTHATTHHHLYRVICRVHSGRRRPNLASHGVQESGVSKAQLWNSGKDAPVAEDETFLAVHTESADVRNCMNCVCDHTWRAGFQTMHSV